MADAKPLQRYYPTPSQLKTPEDIERALRQILKQHYELSDAVAANTGNGVSATATRDAQGPATTKLLGLDVEPIDTQELADGSVLKYSKQRGTLYFG
jgi:hypothetical protein